MTVNYKISDDTDLDSYFLPSKSGISSTSRVGPTENTSSSPGTSVSFSVPKITVDAYGRITAVGSQTVKINAQTLQADTNSQCANCVNCGNTQCKNCVNCGNTQCKNCVNCGNCSQCTNCYQCGQCLQCENWSESQCRARQC